MKEQYLASVKKSLLSPKNKKDLFFHLINHFEIKKIKELPDFYLLKDFLISLKIDPQEIFEKIAIRAVQNKKLNTIKFLIDECGYDLTETVDSNKITLLHEACLYGANDIVEYLLKKGFKPNAPDWQGDTPLHRVVTDENNTPIIAILKQNKANLNIKNHLNLTPLFAAVLYKNSKATLALIKLNRDLMKTTCYVDDRELTYTRFKKEVANGTIKNLSPTVSLSPSEVSPNEQALVKYYYGCLLPEFNQQIFQQVKSQLTKSSEPLNEVESEFLINAWILTSKTRFQSQTFINELLKLIQNGQLTSELTVKGLLNTARNFADQNQREIVEEFNDFVLKKLEELEEKEIDTEKVVNFYHALGMIYKKVGLFLKSEYCLQKAIDKMPEQKTDKDKMEIFFNLACAQGFFLLKKKEALENFKRAFYFDQTDEEAFTHYLTYLLELEYYEEALNICNESRFHEYCKIYTAYIYMLRGNLSWLDLLKVVDTKFSSQSATITALDLKANCYIELDNFNQAMRTSEESLALTQKNFKDDKDTNIAGGMFKVLYVYMKVGEYKSGLELVERFEKEYPLEFGYSVLCNSVAAVFYLASQQLNKAEVLIQKMRNSAANPEMLAHVYLLLAVEIASQKNPARYDTAMQYINLALELEPNNFKGQLYKLLLSILKADKAATKTILQAIEPELLTDTSVVKDLLKERESIHSDTGSTAVVDTSDIASTQEVDDFIPEEPINLELEEYDPVKIHQFFQTEKARLLTETTTFLSQNPKPKTKWKINHICFEEGTEELIRIHHPRFPHCYATIHPNLNSPFLKQFQNALSKSDYYIMDLSENTSKVSRKRNSNVQNLNNSVIQLKINADNRLWTDKVYCIGNKHLIVFDNQGGHSELKRKIRQGTKIKVIDLSEHQLSLVNPHNIRGIFATPSEGLGPENTQPGDIVTTLHV